MFDYLSFIYVSYFLDIQTCCCSLRVQANTHYFFTACYWHLFYWWARPVFSVSTTYVFIFVSLCVVWVCSFVSDLCLYETLVYQLP